MSARTFVRMLRGCSPLDRTRRVVELQALGVLCVCNTDEQRRHGAAECECAVRRRHCRSSV